jgi:hypothetical protein
MLNLCISTINLVKNFAGLIMLKLQSGSVYPNAAIFINNELLLRLE